MHLRHALDSTAGLDSLSAVELHAILQQQLGLKLPATLVFDYPTISSISAYVHAELAASVDPGSAAAGQHPVLQTSLSVHHTDSLPSVVTIDATAARLSAPSISSTVDSCRVTPYSRWDVDSNVPGVPHRFGSRFARCASAGVMWAVRGAAILWCSQRSRTLLRRFLQGVEDFDASAFGIAPSEAVLIDPQQRMMLEVGIQ